MSLLPASFSTGKPEALRIPATSIAASLASRSALLIALSGSAFFAALVVKASRIGSAIGSVS